MKKILSILIATLTIAQAQTSPTSGKPVAHELVAKINTLIPEGETLGSHIIQTGRKLEWQKSPGHIALLQAIRDYQKQLKLIKKQGEQSASDDSIIKQTITLKEYHIRIEELTTFIKLPTTTLQKIQTWLDQTDISLLPYLQPYNQRRLAWLVFQEDRKRTLAAQATDQRVAQLQKEAAQAKAERIRLEREINNQPTPAPIVIIHPPSSTPACPPSDVRRKPVRRPTPICPTPPRRPIKPTPKPDPHPIKYTNH